MNTNSLLIASRPICNVNSLSLHNGERALWVNSSVSADLYKHSVEILITCMAREFTILRISVTVLYFVLYTTKYYCYLLPVLLSKLLTSLASFSSPSPEGRFSSITLIITERSQPATRRPSLASSLSWVDTQLSTSQ